MTAAGRTALQHLLLTRYNVFKKRLTKYLGSADLAGDALQDTWLRLERGGDVSSVDSPDNYLYSMAVNAARDRQRTEARRLTTIEIEALMQIEDKAPSPARLAESRAELRALVSIIGELPVRQQAILIAARLDDMPRDDIARRFGVSVRLVQRELQKAHDYCAVRLQKITGAGFTSGTRETSTSEESSATAPAKRPGTRKE